MCLQEDDITKMLAATTHIGPDNSETTMEQYIFKKKNDGVNIINLKVDFYLRGVRLATILAGYFSDIQNVFYTNVCYIMNQFKLNNNF